MTHSATIFNIINIFSFFLLGCYNGTFDHGHIELWNEVIHAILYRFTDDQQKVVRRMVI